MDDAPIVKRGPDAATPRGTAARFAHLLLAALALGTLANTVGPHRVAWVRGWSGDAARRVEAAGLRVVELGDLRRAVEEGAAVIFDARKAEAFRRGHLPGAVSLPVERAEEELPHVQPLLAPDQDIIVYCFGLDCDESLRLALYLHRYGYTNTSVFAGGLYEWRRAGGEEQRTGGGSP